MTVHMLGESTSSNSRPVRGPEPRGEQSGRGGVLCARSGRMLGKSLLFPSSCQKRCMSRRGPVGVRASTWGFPRIREIGRRCAEVGFPPRTPFVTPVLPGPGSDIRMKMGWKIKTKTEKSGVWFFQNVGVCGRGGYFRCLRALLIGYGRDRTSTAWAVPCGSSCSCSYSYGRGPAIGSQTGERCWPLLAGVWRAVAPLMKPWCAEGEVPTAANLNLYRGRDSCVRWHCDDEPLVGRGRWLGLRSSLFR